MEKLWHNWGGLKLAERKTCTQSHIVVFWNFTIESFMTGVVSQLVCFVFVAVVVWLLSWHFGFAQPVIYFIQIIIFIAFPRFAELTLVSCPCHSGWLLLWDWLAWSSEVIYQYITWFLISIRPRQRWTCIEKMYFSIRIKSLLKTFLSRPKGDLDREIPLYTYSWMISGGVHCIELQFQSMLIIKKNFLIHVFIYTFSRIQLKCGNIL